MKSVKQGKAQYLGWGCTEDSSVQNRPAGTVPSSDFAD